MRRLSDGCLARVTHLAVVRGAALAGQLGADRLAALLYRAGGVVVDERIDPRWPQHLVDRAQRPVRAALDRYDHGRTDHWHGWTLPGSQADELVHKVYVSPAVSALTSALPLVLTTAVDRGVAAWKIGADPAGLHRPDKIVLYLPTAADADRVAVALSDALAGMTAQGVPFTGQVGASAIVSRGRDVGGDSWRAVVCREVAEALTDRRAALGAGAGCLEVADTALDRLEEMGYDVVTWCPRPVERSAVRA